MTTDEKRAEIKRLAESLSDEELDDFIRFLQTLTPDTSAAAS